MYQSHKISFEHCKVLVHTITLHILRTHGDICQEMKPQGKRHSFVWTTQTRETDSGARIVFRISAKASDKNDFAFYSTSNTKEACKKANSFADWMGWGDEEAAIATRSRRYVMLDYRCLKNTPATLRRISRVCM